MSVAASPNLVNARDPRGAATQTHWGNGSDGTSGFGGSLLAGYNPGRNEPGF